MRLRVNVRSPVFVFHAFRRGERRCVGRIRNDIDTLRRDLGAKHRILAACVAHADAFVDAAQETLQDLVDVNRWRVAEPEQRVIRKASAKPKHATVEHCLVA